jgi:hypothetical protein
LARLQVRGNHTTDIEMAHCIAAEVRRGLAMLNRNRARKQIQAPSSTPSNVPSLRELMERRSA